MESMRYLHRKQLLKTAFVDYSMVSKLDFI